MSEPAHALAISIPRSSQQPSFASPPSTGFHFDSVFSPTAAAMSTTSPPLSIASPFSASSGGSLGGGRASATSSGDGNAGSSAQMLASSFATTVSSYSPPRMNDDKDSKAAGTVDTNAASSSSVDGDQALVKKHKPHKCEICQACFARKVHLQRHSLRHQVCKPYCCDRCNKCFSRQDSLVRHHRLLHEKAKPDKKGGDKNKEVARACVRCSSIAVPCDGQSPCGRCFANHGGESCVYAPMSSTLTIGAATAKSLKRTKKQSKGQGKNHADDASTTTSDAPTWSTFSRAGARRDTISSMASGWSEASTTSPFQQNNDVDGMAASNAWNIHNMHASMPPLYGQPQQLEQWQLQQLYAQQLDTNHGGSLVHPFDMLQMSNGNDVHGQNQQGFAPMQDNSAQQGDVDMDTGDDNLVPQLLSLIGFSGQETPMPRGHTSQNAAQALQNIDWNAMLHNLQQSSQHSFQPQQQAPPQNFFGAASGNNGGNDAFQADSAARMPFTGAASDKAMNATLFNAMEHNGTSSDYASPSMPSMSGNGATMASMGSPQQQASAFPPNNNNNLTSGAASGNDVVSLAALGIPVPPTLNINLPANLQMSADHWDNFMRCLSSYALTRQQQQQSQTQNSTMSGDLHAGSGPNAPNGLASHDMSSQQLGNLHAEHLTGSGATPAT